MKEEEKKPVVDLDKDKWDSGSDLSLEVEVEEKPRENKEEVGSEMINSDIFVPPAEGVDPLKELLRANPSNAALNVVGGDFRKGLELLKNQLGVTNMAPLKQLFVDALTLTRARIQPLPHGPSLTLALK